MLSAGRLRKLGYDWIVISEFSCTFHDRIQSRHPISIVGIIAPVCILVFSFSAEDSASFRLYCLNSQNLLQRLLWKL